MKYKVEKYLTCNGTKYDDNNVYIIKDILHMGSIVNLASSIFHHGNYILVDYDDKSVKLYDTDYEEFKTCDYEDFQLALYGFNARNCTIKMVYKICTVDKNGENCIDKTSHKML